MASGLFILLQDEESLQDCVYNGFYGFLMTPVYEEKPSSHSKHYAALCDYACCETGTEIFFFTRRSITYGGKITATNGDSPVFYLNGDTSPIGRKANSNKYIDMSNRFETTDKDGVYHLGKNSRNEDRNRAMPFIIEFDNNMPLSGKQITSDELYFRLGDYNYPFPSNSIQSRGMCTLTPKETEILLDLVEKSNVQLSFDKVVDVSISDDKVLFDKELILSEEIVNEAHLEFKLLADKESLDEIVSSCFPNINPKEFVRCRQVPLCPFRPIQFDLADICLYDEEDSINDKTLPNIVIELKKDKNVSYSAYNQTTKYLRWLKQISDDDFDKVKAIIVAPDFSKNLSMDTLIKHDINLEFKDKIVLYSLNRKCVVDLE